MSFLVKECPKTYVVGFSTLVSIPQDPNDFSEMSAHKLEQLANLRQIKEDLESQAIDRHFYAVNDATASPALSCWCKIKSSHSRLEYF